MNKKIKEILIFVLFLQITAMLPVTQIQNLTDPFSPQRNKKNLENKSESLYSKDELKLIGVVKMEGSFGAVVQKENEQEVVFLNDKIWGYSVKNIQDDSVVLLKGGVQIRLLVN